MDHYSIQARAWRLEDVSGDFYHWTTVNHAIATTTPSATHTGVSIGSTTSNTWGYLESNNRIKQCPLTTFYPSGGANVNPVVTIGSFSQNPILQGSTATVTVTVNGSGTITLTITSSGTGAAKFDNQNGSTTKTISGTTTVTIYGSTASGNTGDLTLTASYNGAPLTSSAFSVTSGACTLGSESGQGSGYKNCPTSVTLSDYYNVSQWCPTCQYSCVVHPDSAWTPGSCSVDSSHTALSLVGTVNFFATGSFSAGDCNWHYTYFIGTVVNAQGVPTNYTGANLGLHCTNYPNGNPCP